MVLGPGMVVGCGGHGLCLQAWRRPDVLGMVTPRRDNQQGLLLCWGMACATLSQHLMLPLQSMSHDNDPHPPAPRRPATIEAAWHHGTAAQASHTGAQQRVRATPNHSHHHVIIMS